MQATYKIIGADGVEYGPVGLSDFKTWVTEGRVDSMTHVMRSDAEGWTTAANLPELGLRDNPAGTNPRGPAVDPEEAADLEQKIKRHSSWFYWIGALTLLNSLAAFFHSEWGFYLGISALQALDYAVAATPIAVRALVLSVDLSVAIGFGALGFAASRKMAWPFAVGAAIYGLDTLLNVLAVFFGGSIVGLILHGWALFCLVAGFRAAQELRRAITSAA